MSLDKIKSLGMFQNTFMFHVSIPVIPILGVNNLQFTIRSTTIPAYTRNKNLIRYMNNQMCLPAGKEFDGEWSITSLIVESFDDYKKMVKWFFNVDTYSVGIGVNSIKANAYVKMIGLDEATVNHRFRVEGLFPLNIPEFATLDQEGADGFVSVDWNFAYDKLNYDEDDKLKF